MTETVFTYGTLCNPSVRRGLLGHEVLTTPAELLGWEKSTVRIGSTKYPAILPNPEKSVQGLVFQILPQELKQLDEYETGAYHRRKVTLADGCEAWVYVKVI